jgi:hypothetical protein
MLLAVVGSSGAKHPIEMLAFLATWGALSEDASEPQRKVTAAHIRAMAEAAGLGT